MTITEPKELTYSHNPIVVKAESDQLDTFDGSRYELTFTFPTGFDSGGIPIPVYDSPNTIVFDVVTFSFVDTEEEQNESSCFLDGNIQNWIDTFNSNSEVNRKYFAQRVDFNTCKIIALFKGSTYNTIFITSDINGTIVVNSQVDGTDSYYGDTKTDYGVYCEIYEGDVADFLNITTPEKKNFLKRADLLLNYRKDNIYEFDLSEVLRTYLSRPLPSITTSGLFRVGEQIGYYCRIGEVYRVSDVYRKRAFDSETTPRAVMLGAVDLIEENDATIHYNGKSLSSADCRPFYRGKGKYNFAFLKGTSGTAGLMTLNVVLYYFDGTSQSISGGVVSLTAQNGIYYFNFDESSISLEGYETLQGSKVEYIELYVSDTVDGDYTEKVSFEVMDEPKYHKTLAFRNRYGVIELVSFTGIFEEGIDWKTQNFEKYYPLNPETSDFNLATLDTDVRKKYSYSSGYMKKGEFDGLIDLVKSTEVYEVENDEYYAIVPTGFGYQYDDETDLYNVTIDAVKTITENNL